MGLIKKKAKDLSSLEALISDFASKPIRIITILFTIFIVLFPLYWLISSTFKYPQDYLAFPPVIFPTRFTLDSFIEIIQRDKVFEIMFNSLYVATCTTIISVIIGSMAAYALQRDILHDKVRGILGLWFLVQKCTQLLLQRYQYTLLCDI